MYVIRTSEDQHLSAEDTIRHYKSLAHVERAFRCLKGIDLRVRPFQQLTPATPLQQRAFQLLGL